jgi:hypothetical protein
LAIAVPQNIPLAHRWFPLKEPVPPTICTALG